MCDSGQTEPTTCDLISLDERAGGQAKKIFNTMYIFDGAAEGAIRAPSSGACRCCNIGYLIAAGLRIFRARAAQAPTAATPPSRLTRSKRRTTAAARGPDCALSGFAVAQICGIHVPESGRGEPVVQATWTAGRRLGSSRRSAALGSSVKALTASFGPGTWTRTSTGSPGRRLYNQQPDVMEAIQAMRQRAQEAGT